MTGIYNRVYLKLIIVFLLAANLKSYSQLVDFSTVPKSAISYQLKSTSLTDELLVQYVGKYNNYPPLLEFKGEHIFTVKDSLYGDIPFKLFIPENYNSSVATPLILLLHGAVKASKFTDAGQHTGQTEVETDPFYGKLCQSGFVVAMPYADPDKGFSWGSNKYGRDQNFTFNALTKIVAEIKKSVNIDDNKVFAFGHSDGSDGAFALDVHLLSPFAGFVCYNSMLTNLFSKNVYLANTVNRPLYVVHSDKDDLRPIEQTRAIVKLLDSLKAPVHYKEYYGYTHQDKHLSLDFPYSVDFIRKTERNPYPTNIYWELNDRLYEKCDWIVVKDWNLNLPVASWHKTHNLFSYNKRTREWDNRFPYYSLSPSAAIKCSYKNNVFDISTSRVTSFEVLISPAMVDLGKEVKVLVNGKTAFQGKVKADKNFIVNQFQKEQDRKAVWVTSVIIE